MWTRFFSGEKSEHSYPVPQGRKTLRMSNLPETLHAQRESQGLLAQYYLLQNFQIMKISSEDMRFFLIFDCFPRKKFLKGPRNVLDQYLN